MCVGTTCVCMCVGMCVVADYLEGRSQEQCATRWSRLKEIERTKYHTWRTEEDMVCSLVVDLFLSVIHRSTNCWLLCPGRLFILISCAYFRVFVQCDLSFLLLTWEHL